MTIKGALERSFENLQLSFKYLEDRLTNKDINNKNFDYMKDEAIDSFVGLPEKFLKCFQVILLEKNIDAQAPKDILSKAYEFKLIDGEESWISMLKDRDIIASIGYQPETQREMIFNRINHHFQVSQPVFESIRKKVTGR